MKPDGIFNGKGTLIACVVAIAIVLILLVAFAVSGSALAMAMLITIIGLVVGFGLVHVPYLFFRWRGLPETAAVRRMSIVALVLAITLSIAVTVYSIALVDTPPGHFLAGFGIGLLVRAGTLLRDRIVRRQDV